MSALLLECYGLVIGKLNQRKEKEMTLQQLKYVIEVARSRSISKAAQALFISQPSLSNALKELKRKSASKYSRVQTKEST